MGVIDRPSQRTLIVVAPKGDQVAAEFAVSIDPNQRLIEIRDDLWSASFGAFQEQLSRVSEPAVVEIDLSTICWFDPLPLLSLLTTIRAFCSRTNSHVSVQLDGQVPDDNERGAFLKFFSQHGFLSAITPISGSTVLFKGARHFLNDESEIWSLLASDSYTLTYPDSRCLAAKILRPNAASKDLDRIVALQIQPWLDDIRNFGLSPYFEGNPEVIDDMMHKLRVLLTELVHNSSDHAYRSSNGWHDYYGLYVRIRQATAPGESSSTATHAIARENLSCPTMSQFHRDHLSSWIEVFYVDSGRGFLSDKDEWQVNAGKKLRNILSSLKPHSNALQRVGRYLFQHPVSRHDRTYKTRMTGLQHIRLVMADGEDFARLYSSGEWIGATHPWSHMTLGGYDNVAKRGNLGSRTPAFGTAWHFCIKLNAPSRASSQNRLATWTQISPETLDHQYSLSHDGAEWTFFDERNLGSGINYTNWQKEDLTSSRCVWLPGAVTKQHVYQWLTTIMKFSQESGGGARAWLVADVSHEQAYIISEIIRGERIRGVDRRLEIYLLTSDWLLCCFALRRTGDQFLRFDSRRAEQVRDRRAMSLVYLLRRHDSRVFWKGLVSTRKYDPSSAFVKERVIWSRDASGGPCATLKGYLDLTHALIDQAKLTVAARALRRTWYLHARDAECIAADALLSNLLPKEARPHRGKRGATSDDRKKVVVGSIYVTGSTAERAIKKGYLSIHLLQHAEVTRTRDEANVTSLRSSTIALEWLPDAFEEEDPPPSSLPYERIPGTPYIGRGGAKAIPVRRFHRVSPGGESFESSIYPESPQETYDHFLQLGILKLGHWVYGKHHDLLTLNLGLGVDRESLDHGPLIQWVCSELQTQRANGAELVVYPSHTVTEKLIHAIRRVEYSSPQTYKFPSVFIPVHFLGTHSKTSIRIPSLTYDRIRQFLESSPSSRERVVLLDDGVLTGKVQRELEQLVRNAGARSVVHVGLVSRTGLPLYRQYLTEEHARHHRYYWRWDVPSLGSTSTCPLCRATHQAADLARGLWLEDARAEVSNWRSNWIERPVVTHWWRHGITPSPLPSSREITFGKEWRTDRSVVEKYKLTHNTSTGLAATVAELVRISSYKEVGLSVAREPWGKPLRPDEGKWRRARLEILVAQILLFYDDFDETELQARFDLLLSVLLAAEFTGNDLGIEQLSCLTLLLTTEQQAESLADIIIEHVGSGIAPPFALLVLLGVLLRRASIDWRSIRRRVAGIADSHMRVQAESTLTGMLTLSAGESEKNTRNALLGLVLTLGESNRSTHTGFLRKKLTGDFGRCEAGILTDLKTISKCLELVDSTVLSGSVDPDFDIEEWVSGTNKLAEGLSSAISSESARTIEEHVSGAHEFIFAHQGSLAEKFQKAFFCPVREVADYIRRLITAEQWKKKVGLLLPEAKARWLVDGNVRTPVIETRVVSGIEDEMVVFPPIARQMVADFVFDAAHADALLDSVACDLLAELSIANDCLEVELRNSSSVAPPRRRRKAAETIVAVTLLKDPAHREYYSDLRIVRVLVRFPLVSDLARSEK